MNCHCSIRYAAALLATSLLVFPGLLEAAVETKYESWAELEAELIETTILRQWIPMRDGVRLDAEIYLPKTASRPYPTVLIRSPYPSSKTLTPTPVYTAFVENGYAIVYQNERGRYWSEGSNFVATNPRLTEQTVLVLNLEHIAQLYIRSGEWTVDPTEQPMNFGIDNEAPFLIDVGKRGMERYGFNLNPTFRAGVPGDLGGYRSLGVPRVQAIHSGPMYHTSGDVMETISVDGLERAARFYAFFVSEVARATRAEIDPPG